MMTEELGGLVTEYIRNYHNELYNYFNDGNWGRGDRDDEIVAAIRSMQSRLELSFGSDTSPLEVDLSDAFDALGLGREPVPESFQNEFKEGELDL